MSKPDAFDAFREFIKKRKEFHFSRIKNEVVVQDGVAKSIYINLGNDIVIHLRGEDVQGESKF